MGEHAGQGAQLLAACLLMRSSLNRSKDDELTWHIAFRPGQNFMALSHSAAAEEEQSRGNWYCGAFVVGKDSYCARTSTLQSFCEVNRWELLNLGLF